MLAWLLPKLTFANTVSLIALFVALGGTGYAAAQLSRNSVGPAHIKKNAVRAAEVRRGAIGASEIRRGAVGPSEIRAGAVGASEVADGALTAAEFGAGRVAGLNADLLDDRNAADFLLRTEKAADADRLDGLDAGAVGRELFANVDTSGALQPTLVSNNGATDATRINAGNYRVDFGDRDLSACSYQVSSAEFNENQSAQVELDGTDSSRLAVTVHDADAGTNVDGDFNVAVHC